MTLKAWCVGITETKDPVGSGTWMAFDKLKTDGIAISDCIECVEAYTKQSQVVPAQKDHHVFNMAISCVSDSTQMLRPSSPSER